MRFAVMTGLGAIKGADTKPSARHTMGWAAFIPKFIVVAKEASRAYSHWR